MVYYRDTANPMSRDRVFNLVRVMNKDKVFLISGFFLLFLFMISLVSITPYDPYAQDRDKLNLPPSSEHLMGTDHLGRDLFSRIITAGLNLYYVAFISVLIPTILGIIIGIVSGYYGGMLDEILMRLVDTIISFPAVLLALGIITALEPSLTNAIIAIGIIFTPRFIRIVRGQVLKIVRENYLEAAQSLGASTFRIMFYHILPGVIPVVVIQASYSLGVAIIAESSLSFLGFAAQPPEITLGLMIRFGFHNMWISIWPAFFSSLILSLTIMAFNYFGDGLRRIVDVRTR